MARYKRRRNRWFEATDEEWAAITSWAASYGANPRQLVLQVMRTWRKHKYPIEWLIDDEGEEMR